MKKRTAAEIREAFLAYFEKQGHRRVASSSLVPQNDPTLLFTNAGMNQFKDVFTGREKRDYTRATSSQKCVRAGGKHNDLDNVGYTARHHTFFEMLGNFSFGDYFKKDAVKFGWEFVTSPEWLGIDPALLSITIFEGEGKIPADTEAEQFWKDVGVRPERIFRLGRKDNFWQMGPIGPCGPCTEMHVYRGLERDPKAIDEHAKKFFVDQTIADSDAWMEIWNHVFMQFEMFEDGSLKPLPKPCVDTGAGLERLTAVVQGVASNYDTDLLRSIIARAEELSHKKYGASTSPDDVAMRVIADHSRSTAFLVADGVLPSNEGRGYTLRRIMRRAIRYGSRLGLKDPFLFETADRVVELMGGHYTELKTNRSTILEFAKQEEIAFRKTLDKGTKMLAGEMEELGQKKEKAIPFKTIFFLHDTHGFPPDLTRIIAAESGFTVDEDGYKVWLEQQKTDQKFAGSGEQAVADVYHQLQQSLGDTEFIGYDHLEAEAKARALLVGGKKVDTVAEGQQVEIVTGRTPFYGESGGQVGDTGAIEAEGLSIEVTDTKKPVGGLIVHHGRVKKGTLHVGGVVKLKVDAERRAAIRRNHSATHLLQHALRQLLGDKIKQAGSKVAPDGFRFDYSGHFSPLTGEQVAELEEKVNALVRQNVDRDLKIVGIEEARKEGAMMLFGEKYGAEVRMVRFGPSLELCGGTHVDHTGDIGTFLIASDESLAQGVRRIWAVTGAEAIRQVQESRKKVRALSDLLRASPDQAEKAAEKLWATLKTLEKELDALKKKGSAESSGDLAEKAKDVNGVKVVTARIDPADVEGFRDLADKLRDKLPVSVIALGGEKDGKAVLLVAVSKDAVAKGNKAGDIVKEISKEVGGRGGGKPDLAQAGGPDPSKIPQALERVYALVK